MIRVLLRSLQFVLATVLSLYFVASAEGASTAAWIRVTEGNISVYTRSDSPQASELIHSFSQLRNALAQASPLRVNQNADLKIIAFQSEKDFNQYRLNAGSCAFYQQTRHGDYIVLQDLELQHRDVSAHEFTHFIVAHSGLNLPLWLNEGIADFYSTFQIAGNRVIFGRSVAGRLGILRSEAWLPLNSLFDIATTSSYYSDPERMALFYSESWALTHMLVASPSYADRFPYFLRAIGEGHTAAESLQSIYNKTLTQIQDDLHDYLDHQHLPLVEARLATVYEPSLTASVASVSNAEMDITLADLEVTNPNARTTIESRLANASGQLPNNAGAEEALGYLALRQGKTAEARAHLQLAVDRHSNDPNVFFYLAHLDHAAGAPSSQVIPLLDRALTLNPELGDARLELALIATGDGNFSQALQALQKLTEPRPENAYVAAYTEAYCYAHVEKLSEARRTAQRAQTLAANDRDRAEVAELLEYIQQQSGELSTAQ